MHSSRIRPILLILGCSAALLGEPAGQGADAPKKRVVVGKSIAPAGMLVRRPAPDQPWQVVKAKEDVHSEELLLALPFAAIEVKNDIRLALIADLDGRTPFPAIESAVILHDNPDVDLDFTLDRGRAAFSNHKSKGAARVKVRFHNQVWTLTLAEPKTRVALEIYGRWPRGVPFTKKPGPDDVPAMDAVVLVLHGQATLNTGGDEHLLEAPGSAFFQWDSVSGGSEPRRLPKLPDWADEDQQKPNLIKLKTKLVRLERLRELVNTKSVEGAIDEFLASDDPLRRRLAIYAAGATDDLKRLSDTLIDPKHTDVWDNGVLAVRHWLGRCAGQDQKFYDYLVKERKYSETHAAIVLQLCHSFGERDLERPACYEMLIEYLRHDKMPIRTLSYWHLYRLVPAGRKIAYDPAGSADSREAAYREWKKLIPDGKLPPEDQ